MGMAPLEPSERAPDDLSVIVMMTSYEGTSFEVHITWDNVKYIDTFLSKVGSLLA